MARPVYALGMTKSENIKAGTVIITTMGSIAKVVHLTPASRMPGGFYVEYADGTRGYALVKSIA